MEQTKIKNRTIPQICDEPKILKVPGEYRYLLKESVILFLSNYLVDISIHLNIHLVTF